MRSRDFAFWLQGLFELGNPKILNEEQTDLIKRHLNMVFIHEIDPSDPPEKVQQLNQAHNPFNQRGPFHPTGGDQMIRC